MHHDSVRSRKVKMLNEELEEIRERLHTKSNFPSSPAQNTRNLLETVALGWKLIYQRDVLLEELRIEEVIKEE